MEKGLFFAFVLWVIFYCGIRSNRIWNSMVVWDCLLSICTVWSCVIGFDSLCTYCNASLEQLGLGCCIWESHLSWACFPFPGTRRLWVLAVSDDERGWFILVWNWSLHINIVTFLESVWLNWSIFSWSPCMNALGPHRLPHSPWMGFLISWHPCLLISCWFFPPFWCFCLCFIFELPVVYCLYTQASLWFINLF